MSKAAVVRAGDGQVVRWGRAGRIRFLAGADSTAGSFSVVESIEPPGSGAPLHVHHGEAEAFYAGVLGFDVTVRGYPGALFVSAGGYHHHIGLNTWNSRGAEPPPPGAVGLVHYEIVLPSQQELDRVLARVTAAGLTPEPARAGVLLRDPSGNALLLKAAGDRGHSG